MVVSRTTGPISTNLAQIIFGCKGFKFLEIKCQTSFHGEVMMNYIDEIFVFNTIKPMSVKIWLIHLAENELIRN